MDSDERDVTYPHLPARPWRYEGMGRAVYQAIPGDPSCPILPGACCDHCGEGIMETHRFVSTKTGKAFVVGSTCVMKMAAEARTASLSSAVVAIRKARNEAARKRRAAQRVDLRAACRERVEANRSKLAALPHPLDWRAAKGETAEQWADAMLLYCGLTGLKKFARQLDSVLGGAS